MSYDILGSIAHTMMLERQRILGKDEAGAIVRALRGLHAEWKSGRFALSLEHEDVHMNVEAAVTKKTPHGMKMHTARSRNDQVLLDMRMYMRDSILRTCLGISRLKASLAKLSRKDGPMVGYTHTRVAQPITVSLWCDAHVRSLSRDADRLMECYRRANVSPLGACALAGTAWRIDRRYTAKLLGFRGVQENELDTISSRGELEAELLSALAIMMAKLSGMAEELIWLSQKGLVRLPDRVCTGSSIMPNKKNPDILELVRGRTGRSYGALMHALSVKKGLASGYHSDMQETKYAVMQGVDTAASCLGIMAIAAGSLSFDHNAIEKELEGGYAQATEIADRLAMRGIPFREAHGRAGRLVRRCEGEGKAISALGHDEAGRILGVAMGESEWRALCSLNRARLRRHVNAPKNGGILREMKKIEKAYRKLLR